MAEKVTIGNAELWHGDCRDVLPTLLPCEALVTDAPRVYHSSFEYTLDASTLYARAVGIPGEETYALVKMEE